MACTCLGSLCMLSHSILATLPLGWVCRQLCCLSEVWSAAIPTALNLLKAENAMQLTGLYTGLQNTSHNISLLITFCWQASNICTMSAAFDSHGCSDASHASRVVHRAKFQTFWCRNWTSYRELLRAIHVLMNEVDQQDIGETRLVPHVPSSSWAGERIYHYHQFYCYLYYYYYCCCYCY